MKPALSGAQTFSGFLNASAHTAKQGNDGLIPLEGIHGQAFKCDWPAQKPGSQPEGCLRKIPFHSKVSGLISLITRNLVLSSSGFIHRNAMSGQSIQRHLYITF